MNFLERSLGAKVLVLVSFLTIAAFTGLFCANSYWQYQSTTDQISAAAKRCSELLRMAIEGPMALGRNDDTIEQFKQVAQHQKDMMVFMTNSKGQITYSTDTSTLRKDLNGVIDDKRFSELLSQSLKSERETGERIKVKGTEFFVEVSSIANAPDCHHCHGASKPILGSMVTFKNITSELRELTNAQYKSAAISLTGLVLLLASLLIFMRKVVINRISLITNYTEMVSQGNITTCFEVGGKDELGELCNNLTAMVQTLQDQLQYSKSILEGIIIPLFVTDASETLEFANRPLRSIFGMTKEEMLGVKVSNLLRGKSESVQVAADVLKNGESVSGLMRFTRADGVEFPLHYEISPLRNSQEQVVGSIGLFIDLTKEERDKQRIRTQREHLVQVANEVTEVAMRLSESADELTTQMEELTKGMDQTAEETSQVAESMQQMNEAVLDVSRNASETARVSDEASSIAKQGGEEMGKTVKETKAVAERTQRLASSLGELSSRAVNIGQVLGVISDIADQTNLLALNAAIEAARAGEAGRGFAVVADEVRKLAEKTMRATSEVAEAIHEIQTSTTMVVEGMSETQAKVESTSAMSENSGKLLNQIMEQSILIADRVRAMATASEQQSASSEEINNSVNHISDVSQDISIRIQSANFKIQELREISKHLSELVVQFQGEDNKAISA